MTELNQIFESSLATQTYIVLSLLFAAAMLAAPILQQRKHTLRRVINGALATGAIIVALALGWSPQQAPAGSNATISISKLMETVHVSTLPVGYVADLY
jgi:hypothetical protein